METYPPKVEGVRPHPVNGTEEEARATGDAIELEPPSQGSEVKGELPPAPPTPRQGDPQEEEEILFQEAFQIEWPVLQEKSEGGGWG